MIYSPSERWILRTSDDVWMWMRQIVATELQFQGTGSIIQRAEKIDT